MNKIYLCAGNKGGTGKSMVATALIDAFLQRGVEPLLIETDDANPDVFKAHSVCVIAAIIKRGERRLPIVAVNDIGLPINCRDYFKYRSCKKCKSFGVVIMAVNTVTLKIILVIKEVENNTVQLCLKNSAVLAAPAYGNGN